MPNPATIDFETFGIERRPSYPPKPVGVSIQLPGERTPTYYAWGHPTGNNCTFREGTRALRRAWEAKDGILCHNGKFDYDVATTHCGLPDLSWHKIHDTLYLLYLNDPHAMDLGLKPSAARLLNMPPEEQDAVVDWLVEHQPVPGVRITRGKGEHGAGRYICMAPGELVGRYAKGDVTRTLRLFRLLYPKIVKDGMLKAYDRERRLMPILLQNEREGVRVNVAALEAGVALYTDAAERADNWLRKQLRAPSLNLDSPAELADALDKAGIVTEWNLTATGKRSTAKGSLTVDMFTDKRIASALGYRNRLGTCLGTFMRPWLAMAQGSGGIIQTNWNQVRNTDTGKGTRTGRLSTNPNFQNLTKDWYDKNDGYRHPSFLKLPELPSIRRYTLPDKGQVWGHRDYNQQELRILAHFEDDKLLARYVAEPRLDVHQFVKEEITNLTGMEFERRAVKILNFGMLYGMGLGKLAEGIGCDVNTARALRNGQRKALPGAFDLDKSIKAAAGEGEPIRTWGGRLYYCEPPLIINGKKISFEYKLLNYLIQGSAADCTKEALIRYHEAKKHGRFLVTVHDEINISAPAKAMKEEMAILRDCMQGVEFDLPMLNDGKTGPNWGELKEYKV
jgi:DNA polymerase-1